MAKTLTYTDFAGIEHEIPAMYAVCDRCNGEGRHTNPNIDADGLTEDFINDPEFMENYRNGVYDVTCSKCNGKRVMLVPNENIADPEDVEEYYREQREIEKMYAEIDAERRFGA
ncbi:MAG: hypothetical protein DRO67_00015 [Candidatus Asgardarchaeum californiense]|nr:MAG: hypothetical protein DRO67_00015 [Candidatus Asgardarchaeum californiense]